MIRVYLALGVAVSAGLLLLRLDYVVEQRDALKKTLARTELVLKYERENSAKIASLRDAYYIDLTEARAKNEEREKCISDGTCVATIRVRVPTSCPAPANDDTSGAEASTAELDAIARRAYTNLKRGIVEHEAWDRFCVDTLAAFAAQ